MTIPIPSYPRPTTEWRRKLQSDIIFQKCVTGGAGSNTLSCRWEGRAAYKGRTLSLGNSGSRLRAMSRIMRTADSISSWPVKNINTSPLQRNTTVKVNKIAYNSDSRQNMEKVKQIKLLFYLKQTVQPLKGNKLQILHHHISMSLSRFCFKKAVKHISEPNT